jgi:large conductance mechanosensitive channel
MQFWQEFKKFAVKGNMVDLAIGIIIGAAFNKIVDTLVKQVIMPPLGFLTRGTDISDWQWVLRPPQINDAGEVIDPGVVIGYGLFLEACVDFLIVALTIFTLIRFINTLKDKAEDEANEQVPTPRDIQLLSEIRNGIDQLNGTLGATASRPAE